MSSKPSTSLCRLLPLPPPRPPSVAVVATAVAATEGGEEDDDDVDNGEVFRPDCGGEDLSLSLKSTSPRIKNLLPAQAPV